LQLAPLVEDAELSVPFGKQVVESNARLIVVRLHPLAHILDGFIEVAIAFL
jgi:hypothetical protein